MPAPASAETATEASRTTAPPRLPAAASLALPAAPAAADVDDFGYSSWGARYELSLDDEGRALLHVEEHLVADFPDVDQNKGIVRGLATRYQGADLGTTILSVTDAEGAAIPFETDEDDGTLFVLTGTDEYVRGPTDYVISYEMHDVLLTAQDTGGDEFSWDLLPLDSTQAIESFRTEIVLDDDLATRLTGEASCYQGTEGSEQRCEITGPEQGDGTVSFSVASGYRDAGDGVTIAIGFEAGTVQQPAARQPDPVADIGPFAAGATAVGVAVGGWFAVGAHRRRSRRAAGIIVAQYDVPATMPPLLAAELIPGARTPIAAEIIHLAVGGRLRIEDRGDRQPVLHRVEGTAEGDALDEQTLARLFRKGATTVKIPRASESFAERMQKLEKTGAGAAAKRGLTERRRSPLARTLALLSLIPLAVALGLAVWSMIQGRESAAPALLVAIVALIVVLLSMIFAFVRHTVLTKAGAQQHEHLQGVREFIRVAEEDRLRMLQSYSGAERYTRDGVELVHLYERLLPYAILFGMETEWGRVLETRYEADGYEPSWVTGYQTGFMIGYLARFGQTTQSAAHYSAPSTGSSSSFSGAAGGGFSGGGGGGGFSGGR
ncbi:hypothetical protein GCM10027408_35330 [Microbacterium tumbae]